MSTSFWQPNYQIRDEEIVDYEYWDLAGSGIAFRGPAFDPSDKRAYFSCIGAAQTFGCFVAEPYPQLLAQRLGLRAVNLGLGSATPGLFHTNDRIIEVINAGRFAVLQVMAARHVSNSRLEELGTEMVRDRVRGDEVPAHVGWQRILRDDPAALDRYIAETQASWSADFRVLLDRITVPVLLFWFSVKKSSAGPDRTATTVDQLFGPFPQMVEGASVAAVADLCDGYAECTSTRNHNHLLRSRHTGAPVEVDNGVLDPRMPVKWTRNSYYPSPEMHEDAADALLPAVELLAQRHPELLVP